MENRKSVWESKKQIATFTIKIRGTFLSAAVGCDSDNLS